MSKKRLASFLKNVKFRTLVGVRIVFFHPISKFLDLLLSGIFLEIQSLSDRTGC